MRDHRRLHALALAATALAAAASGCGGGGGGGGQDVLASFVSSVRSGDGTVTARRRSGAPPAAVAMGTPAQRASAEAGSVYIPGGTSAIPVDSTASRVIVAISGVDGYWELTGLTPGPTVLVTFGQHSPTLTFTVRVGTGDAGAIGSYADVPVTLTPVGTGDVQVNVTWDQQVDVDLHVLDPAGAEIFWSQDTSASGGALDLDSNAGCIQPLDGKKVENITWPTGKAPHGNYRVAVDYYAVCPPFTGKVNYVVTVNIAGKAAQTFTGSFVDGDADGGDLCIPVTGLLTCTHARDVTSFAFP